MLPFWRDFVVILIFGQTHTIYIVYIYIYNWAMFFAVDEPTTHSEAASCENPKICKHQELLENRALWYLQRLKAVGIQIWGGANPFRCWWSAELAKLSSWRLTFLLPSLDPLFWVLKHGDGSKPMNLPYWRNKHPLTSFFQGNVGYQAFGSWPHVETAEQW